MGALHIGYPQAIYVFLIIMSMSVALTRFGEPKRGRYGFAEVIVAPAIVLGLLYWGGFFSG